MADDLFPPDWKTLTPPEPADFESVAVAHSNGHRPAVNGRHKPPTKRTKAAAVDAAPTLTDDPVIQPDGSIAVNNSAKVADWLREEMGRNQLAGILLRSGELVYTPQEGEDGYIAPKKDSDSDGPAQVRPVDASRLASRCQYTYTVIKKVWNKDTKEWRTTPALFPQIAAKVPVDVPDLLPNVRILRGVVHAPVLRPDGSLLDQPGYDESTGLLHLPEPGLVVPPVPERPTVADIKLAVEWIDYMLAGFTFASESDKCNFIGLMVTPALRAVLPPPYKLGAIGAPMPGSGKTLLASSLRILHGGVFRAEVPEDEAELRKQVTTILDVTTGPVVQFDNATGTLRSATMAALLTSPDWDDRLLGANKMVHAKNDRLWIVTGNNLSIGGDLIRRTLWCTIDPGMPDPHMRTDFAIKNLEAWVREHRGDLLHAVLVLARAWVAEGMPAVSTRSDSYALWTSSLQGLLGNAGFVGEFDDMSTARQTVGADDAEWAQLLSRIYAVFGDTSWLVSELLGKVGTNGQFDRPISSDFLPAVLADKFDRGQSITKSLGHWIANREGRWADGFAARPAGKNRDGVRLWKVARWEDRP